ncbi:hypothetical protein, partial [Plasmodium yoelii yoelii]
NHKNKSVHVISTYYHNKLLTSFEKKTNHDYKNKSNILIYNIYYRLHTNINKKFWINSEHDNRCKKKKKKYFTDIYCTKFSYEIPIDTRYISTCYSDKTGYNNNTNGEENINSCGNYDAILISNGKLFLDCISPNEINTNIMKNKMINIKNKITNIKNNNFSIYADVENVQFYWYVQRKIINSDAFTFLVIISKRK